jgi:two-component system chemotaxis sensor kinase CheA
MAEIDYSLLGDFLIEASEHLEEMENQLLELRPGQDNKELCNNIFRPIHTIKGASQFVGLDQVSTLSHRLEDLLDLLRNGDLGTTDDIVDVLIEGRDRIAALCQDLEKTEAENTPVDDLVEKVSYMIEHGGELPEELKGGSTTGEKEETAGEIDSDDGLEDLEEMEDEDLDALLAEAEAAESEEGEASEEMEAAFAEEFETDGDESDDLEEELGDDERLHEEFGEDDLAEEAVDESGFAEGELDDDEFDDEPDLAAAEFDDDDFAEDGEDGLEEYSASADDEDAAESLAPQGQVLPVLELDEEYDKELFEIFMQQLRDKVTLIAMLSRALEGSAADVGVLEESLHHLARLRSAANYMGYEALTGFYDQWTNGIHESIEALDEGQGYAPAYMVSQINTLVGSIAQLRDEGLEIDEAGGDIDSDDYAADLEGEQIDPSEIKDFVDQALEHLNDMEQGLLAYEQEPDNSSHLDDVFRAAHTVKGVAQFVGLERISAVAHRMEDLLAHLRQEGTEVTDPVITVLMAARDRLEKLTDDLVRTGREESGVEDVVGALDRALNFQESGQSPEELSGEDLYGMHTREDEATDQELYQIFLDQLAEQLQLAGQDLARYEDGEPAKSLPQLEQRVRHLRHAATYMGYDDLAKRYDQWLKELERAHFAITNGEDQPSLADSRDHVAAIHGMFPDLGEVDEFGGDALDDELANESLPEEQAEAGAESAEPIAEPAEQPDAPVKKHAPVQEKPVAAQSSADEQEDELFVRLTAAMEEKPGQGDKEYETLHNVFELMLDDSSEEEAVPPAPAPKASRPTKAQPAPAKPKPAKAPAAQAKPKPAQAQPKAPEKQKEAAAPAPAKASLPEPAMVDKSVDDRSGEGPTGAASTPEKSERVFKKSVRVDADKIDALMNQVGELIVDRSYFYTLYNEMHELQGHLKEDLGIDPRDLKQVRLFTYRLGEAISSLSRTSNDLQEGVMKVRMLPIAQIFNRYPRLIHDLTNRTNKRVNLVIKGEDTELDKMIVEELSDPMIHIIRNAVDHGFEAIDERKRAGKSEEGTLVVEAYQESNHIVIEVRDDGRGIDTTRIKAKALEKKLHNKDELDRMSQRDLMRLIMHPGFSTADKISRTSGRGVGMDVAKKNIEKLNGNIEVESQAGVGTQIRLKIPLTLAIIPALLVRVGGDSFTIPLSNVEETLRIYDADTSTIEGTEVVHLRGRTMPIFRLSALFNLDVEEINLDKAFVVVVNAGAEQVGLVVDELMGQEEVVIKPLVDYLQEQSGFSGATIIGDGRISLILDVYELVNMTASTQINRLRERERLRRATIKAAGQGNREHGQKGDKATLLH